jgi:flagellar basal body-associated protein FliL
MAEPDALKLLVKQLHELGEYVSYYVTAKTDSAKLSLRNTVLWISFAVLGFVIVAGLIITAAWFLLNGIAEGVSVLFGGRLWVGNIVTGVLLLVGLGFAMYYTVAARRMTSRERMVRKYEQRQARQQAQFGRNVHDPTADTASHKK